MMIESPSQSPHGQFETDTVDAVTSVRDAYSRIIELHCPGSKATSALSDAFGIHRKLAWQLAKVAYSDNPYIASMHMPTPRSNRVWLDAAGAKGVPGDMLASAEAALERFQRVIEEHASSKAEFDMMVEALGEATDAQTQIKWRQLAYQGNSFTLGVHCRVLLGLAILMPSDDREDFFHAVQLRGVIGFRQTRPDIRWVINQSVAVDDDAQHESAMQRAPLDPEAARAHNGVPVLPEFCSDPIPAFSREKTPDGMVQDEFLSTAIGLQGERTLMTGEVMRNIAPTYATEQDKVAHFGTAVRTPAEMAHFDLFVHAGLFGEVQRELRVFSDIASPIAFDDKDALSVCERVVPMGRGTTLVQAPDLPGYASIVSSVFERIGQSASDYELYRVRIPYPPLPTTVMVKHDLLPKD